MKNNKLVHAENNDAVQNGVKEYMKEVKNSSELVLNQIQLDFDLGDKVICKLGVELNRYIEESADYETIFVPKGSFGIIFSSGWNMSNNFKTMFDIIMNINGEEFEISIKEEDMNMYFSK